MSSTHELLYSSNTSNLKEEDCGTKENMQSNNTNNNNITNVSNTTTTNLKSPPPPPAPLQPSIPSSTTVDESMNSSVEINDTNQDSDLVIDTTATDAGVVPVIAADNTTTTTTTITTTTSDDDKIPTVVMTYTTSKESIYYQTANTLLQRGDFETALSTIEDGIEYTKQQLLVSMSMTKDTTTNNDNDTTISLHESLAPFHYLYGTTLLYSIEESTDGLQQQPLTTMEGQHVPTSNGDIEEDDDGDEYDDDQSPYINSNQNDNDQPPVSDEVVDDMEIAWENLDTARMIVEQMLLDKQDDVPTTTSSSTTFYDTLRTDMGQILLREGDLQRQNGAYLEAINDYTKSLSYFENNHHQQNTIYSPKIADVHCNLGAVYFTVVVEIQKGTLLQNNNNNNNNNLNDTTNHHDTNDIEKKIMFYRNRGYYHYYECCKTLIGIIFEFISMNPNDLFQRIITNHQQQQEQDESVVLYCDEHHENYPKLIRSMLSSLRKEVMTSIQPLLDNTTTTITLQKDILDTIHNNLFVLEEIQEIIDEAETSEQGVIEATAMKDEITAMVAASSSSSSSQQHNDSSLNQDETTTISNGFGSISAMASTAIAQPINNTMIIKKKQKKNLNIDLLDVKLPAIVIGSDTNKNDNKRMKINNE